jgi:hypothetical protein
VVNGSLSGNLHVADKTIPDYDKLNNPATDILGVAAQTGVSTVASATAIRIGVDDSRLSNADLSAGFSLTNLGAITIHGTCLPAI